MPKPALDATVDSATVDSNREQAMFGYLRWWHRDFGSRFSGRVDGYLDVIDKHIRSDNWCFRITQWSADAD